MKTVDFWLFWLYNTHIATKNGTKMQALKALFPKIRHNSAATGLIPMSYFIANEVAIRAAAKEYFHHSYRAMFRGPRPHSHSSNTRRTDATGVLLYSR